MSNTSAPAPDFVALARKKGWPAHLPFNDACREIGIGESFGWELIAAGKWRAIRLSGRKTIIDTSSMARHIWECEQAPPSSSQATRIRTTEAAAKRRKTQAAKLKARA
jgi:hypothetical protein